MDPFTHALVGMAIGSYGQSVNILQDPRWLGCVIGSIMPDGDIIFQTFGHYTYLKNHRGISHSIPGITIMTAALSIILKIIFPQTSLLSVFLWTLIGSISHVTLDLLNSYGAQLFWPIRKRKYSLSLLLIYDPVIILISLGTLLSNIYDYKMGWINYILFTLYLLVRILMRARVYRRLAKQFKDQEIWAINILPSMFNLLQWDFIIRTVQSSITGSINIYSNRTVIRDEFPKVEDWLKEKVLDTKAGKFFSDFSPIYHLDYEEKSEGYEVTLIDLRYYMKDRYLHHATILFNENLELEKCVFHPYTLNKNVKIPI